MTDAQHDGGKDQGGTGTASGGRLRAYLRRLTPPDNWLDFTDLLSKTVVAMAAATIAVGLWMYNEHKADLAAQQQDRTAQLQEQRDQSAEGRDTIDMFLKFIPDAEDPKADIKLSTLSSYCTDVGKPRLASHEATANDTGWAVFMFWKSAPEGGTLPQRKADPHAKIKAEPVYASAVTGVLCKAISDRGQAQLGASQDKAAVAAAAAAQSNNGLGYANSDAATSQNAGVAASEASEPAGVAANWYAVVASVPLAQAASVPQLVASLNIKLKQGGAFNDIHVYCTRISRSIALTSGREKSEAQAKGRARLLRNLGLINDAFAQPDRNWVQARDGVVPDCTALLPAAQDGS